MALQRTRRPRIRSGRSLRSLGSPLNARPLGRRLGIGLASFTIASVLLALPKDGPILPYYDWGACPFECCTYREWTLNADTAILKEMREGAPIAFSLGVGERVRGVTGVVVTIKPGLMRVLKPITLGSKPSVSLQPGDLIYTLHYQGEGFDLFWFKGRIYSDQIDAREIDPDPPPADISLQALDLPDAIWWVKIKNLKGQTGWTRDTDHFDHMDACE